MSDRVSRWWWYVPIHILCFLQRALVTHDDVITLPEAIIIGIAWIGFPWVGICLFVDGWKIRASEVSWNPNAYIYGLFGLLVGLSGTGYIWIDLLLTPYPISDMWSAMPSPVIQHATVIVSTIASALYLLQRFWYVGFR